MPAVRSRSDMMIRQISWGDARLIARGDAGFSFPPE
jgi:hypothetical protein